MDVTKSLWQYMYLSGFEDLAFFLIRYKNYKSVTTPDFTGDWVTSYLKMKNIICHLKYLHHAFPSPDEVKWTLRNVLLRSVSTIILKQTRCNRVATDILNQLSSISTIPSSLTVVWMQSMIWTQKGSCLSCYSLGAQSGKYLTV